MFQLLFLGWLRSPQFGSSTTEAAASALAPRESPQSRRCTNTTATCESLPRPLKVLACEPASTFCGDVASAAKTRHQRGSTGKATAGGRRGWYIYILLDKPLSFLSWLSFLHPGHLICYIILELITLMLAGLHYTHQVGQCWLNKTLLIPTCIWLPSNYRCVGWVMIRHAGCEPAVPG